MQNLAFGALKAAVEAHSAKAGGIVVLDVRTGEVLALANVPTYNPNNRARLTGAQLRNRAMTDMFEPGSTLKPFTVALALETGRVTPQTLIQTAPGSLTIGRLHDPRRAPGGALTVDAGDPEVLQRRRGEDRAALPREDMWDLFQRVGFGAAPQLGFPGEAAGRLRPAKTWRPVEQATMAYGHGISVSLVQLARAYTVFARDGELVPLSLLKPTRPRRASACSRAETARAVRAMLELAVQPGGTAPRARIMGWRVAGKTGTAHKQENGGYAARQVHLLVRRPRAGVAIRAW